jgi:hypothetical protein
MVKTSPSSGGPGTANLKDVVDALKTTNLLIAHQGSALNNFIKEQAKTASLAKKDNLEKNREGKGIGRRVMGAGRMGIRGVGEVSGINPAARGLRMLLAPIMSGIGVLLKPLKFLGRLLMKGGPIGLLIGGLFVLFKDIAENPTFNKTIESIKTTWNEKITPLFSSIKESIDAIMGNEDVKATFTSISDWFTNFKTQIQDWVLGNLEIITDTIAGVLEGVDLLLKGDWKAGISKIGSTLFNGIKNFFDNAMTNLLELFGVDFGEGGSFLGSVGDIIDSLLINMITKWREFKQGVKDTWAALVNFFTGDDGYVKTTIANIKESISNAWNTFTTWVSDTWTGMTTGVKNKVSELLEPLTVTLPNKIGEIKDGLIDTWNNIKSKIMEALTNVALWFMFKPKELGLLLEEKWIETKGKFMEKLASFAGAIATIPAQLKLGLLESLKESKLGRFISEDRLSAARAEVNSGQAFADSLLQSTQSKTQEELARIQREREALNAQKRQMEKAAQVLINQNNAGGTTVNTTNLNPNGGSVADPYASSYMGRPMSGP